VLIGIARVPAVQQTVIRTAGARRGSGRKLGDDLVGDRRPDPRRPTHTNAVTCGFTETGRSAGRPFLVRDEEAVGSNPATPTGNTAGQGPFHHRREGP